MQLPANLSVQEFDQQFRLKPELWRAAVIECCDFHNLPSDNLKPFTDGTNLVASVSDSYVVKIFPPSLTHQWQSEHQTLSYLYGKIDIKIPELIASGRRSDGWHYVIISKLGGITFEHCWDQFSDEEKVKVLKHIGQVMKSVHKVPVGGLAKLEPLWKNFYPSQIEKASERHQKLNMPTWFLKDLPGYLNSALEVLPKKFNPVILTGEYTPFNLMTDVIKNPVVSGMIDFGDSMVGYADYDLLGPSLFMAEGKPGLVQALFQGYGLGERQINSEFRRRLMTLQILHRYSHFHAQVRIQNWENRVQSISELEYLIWPHLV